MKRLFALLAFLGALFAAFYLAFECPFLFNKLTTGGFENTMATTAGVVIEKDPANCTFVLDTGADDGSVGEIRIGMASEKDRSLFETIKIGDFLRIRYLRTILPSGGYEFMGLDDDFSYTGSSD